jgi:hypothetical protein
LPEHSKINKACILKSLFANEGVPEEPGLGVS